MQSNNPQPSAYFTLAEKLRERRRLIADRAFYERNAANHLEALKNVSQAIDRAMAALPPPVDPELAHFLSRASYDKALAYLESREG